MRHRTFITLSLLIAASLILAACSTSQGVSETSAAPAGTDAPATTEAPSATQPPEEAPRPLTVLIDNDEGPITPANWNTFIGLWMIGWVYDPLFDTSPNLTPVPALATEYEVSDDGLVWDIMLRDDVNWHDGEPFTAKDVVFSYNFLIEAGRAANLTALENIEATGEHSVRITLTEKAPFFLSEGLTASYILPEHIWRDQVPVSGELSQFQGMVGTGPYRLSEVQPGEFYIFEANPDYFRGEPNVETIIAKIVKDRTQQFNQLRAGEADAVLSSVQPTLVEELANEPDIKLATGSDFFNYIFYANGSKAPFNVPEVRQALALAINAQQLVDVVLLEQGVLLPLSWYHPELPWSENIPQDFDPEAAADLLDEAGLTDSDGDGLREFGGAPTDFQILCDTNNQVEVRATELIVGMLADVGLGARQNCIDIDTAVTFIWPNFVAVPNPEYDLAIWGWSAVPQARRGFIQFMTDGSFGEGVGWANLTGTSDEELSTLINEYVSNPDPDRNDELAADIQERFTEVLPWIPLMSPDGNFAYRPDSYDDWVYMRGTGIMTPWSFLPDDAIPTE